MKAAAAAAELPQHDVTWERCYSEHADLSTLDDTGDLFTNDADLGDAPEEITPAEQQDAETGVVLKAKRSPHLPTEEERRAHEVCHVPYRSWCPACVAGRGRSDRHAVAAESEEHTKPVVSIDYCYLCSDKKDEAKATPILAIRHSHDSWLDALALPSKGTQHSYNAKALAAKLAATGLSSLILRSDQEPAIIELKRTAAKICREEHGMEVILEESPVAESQSNGAAEEACRTVKGMTRTLRHALETLHGLSIGPAHPILPWMVQHGAFLVSRGQLGSDGKTALSRRRGRSYKRDLPAFGEKVLFLQAGKRRSKLEDRWHPGLYIGIADRSDEVLVMDASGVHKARTCKRLDERARVDSGLLNSVTGLPWRPVPGDPAVEEVPISSHLEAPAIVAEAELPPVPMQQTSPHSFHIRKDRELAIYGYTTGCSGCRAARLGLGPQAHSLA